MKHQGAKHWVLAGFAGVALAATSASMAQAAPLPALSRNVLADQSSITEVRYRRHHRDAGAALFGTALGLFALGASGALAGGNDYYDDPYDGTYYPDYGARPYYGGYPQGGYYRTYRRTDYGSDQEYYPVYRHHYGYRQEGWPQYRTNRVGRN